MGKKNTTRLINNTDEVIEVGELRGITLGENNFISTITVKAHEHIDIDPKEYDGEDCRGGQLPKLKIFCGGSPLKSSIGDVLPGEQFFSTNHKTVTIDQLNDQNSIEVVNYKVEFQRRDASLGSAEPLKLSRDPVLNHDNGWFVQVINGNVKLTRKEGVTMNLDPSELFATNIVDDPETSLLRMFLNFWPRTFADLTCKDDLVETVRVVNDLMRQAMLYNIDRSQVEVAKVVEKVSVLNRLVAAKVEWYRPLFPGMEDQFPSVVGQMAEVDAMKLERFATTIKPLLQQPNSLLGRSS